MLSISKKYVVALSAIIVAALSVQAALAATTISTNINTGGNLTVTGTATIGSSDGPLQVNAGLLSATTSIGVLYGGTGLTTAPSNNQILLGNSSSGYTLSATSSLGFILLSSLSATAPATYNALTGAIGFNLGVANSWTALQQFNSNASSSLFSTNGPLYVGTTATTTIQGNNATSSFSGNITINGAFGLDVAPAGGVLNIGTSSASSINIAKSGVTTAVGGPLTVSGATTLANSSTAINSILFGFCNIANSANINASSTAYFNCTGATNLTTSYEVFVQATSSLPSFLIIQSASSSAANTINLQIYNATTTATAPGGISINYWAVR